MPIYIYIPREERVPTKPEVYGDGVNNPTRVNPQTAKLVTSEISFFKTLGRVLLNYGNNDYSPTEAVDRALHHMPFMKNHYRKVRKDISEWRHMQKEMIDAIGGLTKTLEKYKPPYPNPKLTKRKQEEVLLAVEVIKSQAVLKEGWVASQIGRLKDDT